MSHLTLLFRGSTQHSLRHAVPEDEVAKQWGILKSEFCIAVDANDHRKAKQFVSYFEINYVGEQPRFGVAVWNHFATTGPRTNNSVEGYNHKLKRFVATAKPNIYKAIMVFKQEENIACLKYDQANSENPKSNKPPQRRGCDKAIDFSNL